MNEPTLSAHFRSREPSAIRRAQIEFARRTDGCLALNVAIGNVSLPMHPRMQERMRNLGAPASPFKDGVVPYSATVGTLEANRAFLNAIASCGASTEGLHAQITDGGSQAMELIVLGVCGPAGSRERPLLVIDPAYTNWAAMAERIGRRTISVQRALGPDGRFTLPDLGAVEKVIEREKPGAMVVIPYDNPTGQFYGQDAMAALGRLCARHGMWLVSDEAYRELFYTDGETSSVWRLGERDVPGIGGRRISVESASKVWNACGLRIGALVTDSAEFHRRAVAEQTANLCANVIGQHILGALADAPAGELRAWYDKQRAYYRGLMTAFTREMRERLPGILVSSPDAALYSVIDVREIALPGFDANAFVTWCAQEGSVQLPEGKYTLLVAPMDGFYTAPPGAPNPGKTQMRIAYVEVPEKMKLVPGLFAALLEKYEAARRR